MKKLVKLQNSKGAFPSIRNRRRGAGLMVSFGLTLFFLSACSVGPDFVRPQPPSVNHYNYGRDPKETVPVNGLAQRFDNGIGPIANWWKLFNSKALDSAVTQGLADNFVLQAAQANLRQSQDNLRAGSGIFYPQLSATFTQSREKSSPVISGNTFPSRIFNLSTLSATVSYALDIFGGQRRAVESLSAQVDQERAITLGTYIMLTGNIVNTCIAIAAYQAEIEEVERLIVLEKDQTTIAEKQYQAGLIFYGPVLALRTQLEALEATLPPLRQKLTQAEHLLATLAGKTPAEWPPQNIVLNELSLPQVLPLSLPSELVRQRPDILAAEAQLHSASAEIGVATAALFPSFTLNANYGKSSQDIGNLFNGKSTLWGVGGDVVAPLFNGGTRIALRKSAIDAYQQSFALYRQTVLAAFAQVADIVRALEHDAEVTEAASRAVRDAELSMNLIEHNYDSGITNYLQVMVTDIQYRQAKISYLQAQAQQLQDTTALFVALGGGWSNDLKAREKVYLHGQ